MDDDRMEAATDRRRARTLVRVVAWVGLVCSVLIGVVVSLFLLSHQRDEAAYLDYVERYGNYNGQALKEMPTQQALIDAGDRACDWLGERPIALWHTDNEYRVNTLFGVYTGQMGANDRALPRAFLPGAWEYLCPATKAVHKPHYIFSTPGD